MDQAEAASILQHVVALARARDEWIDPTGLSLTITSELTGTITRHCELVETEITRIRREVSATMPKQDLSEYAYLPVCRIGPEQSAEAFHVRLTQSSKVNDLYALGSDALAHEADPATVVPDEDRELVVRVLEDDLAEALVLSITAPLAFSGERQRWGPALLRQLWRDRVSPVGTIDIPVPHDVRAKRITMELPAEIVVDRAILTVDAGLADLVAGLSEAADTYRDRTGDETPEADFLAVQQRRLGARLRSVASQLKALEDRIERPGVGDPAERSRVALETARTALARLITECDSRARPGAAMPSAPDLVDIATQAAAAAAPVCTVKVASEVTQTAVEGTYQLRDELLPATSNLTLVFSPTAASAERVLDNRSALLGVALVLALLAWRLGLGHMWGWDDDDPGQAILDSRESIVALLVVFPALLYSRLERFRDERRIIKLATGVTLALASASAAALTPVGIAMLAIGDIDEGVIVRFCVGIGLLLAAAALLLTLVLRPKTLAARRAAVCARELEA